MIKSSFYSFETAKRAIMNSQLGLDVVGNNISNVSTAGYTRQRVDQVSFGMNGSKSKFAIYGRSLPGQGSAAIGISQIRDPFLDNRYRSEFAEIGDLSVKNSILTELESIFDGINKDGLWAKYQDLIDSFTIKKADATAEEISNAVMAVSKQLMQILNKNAAQLETMLTENYNDFKSTIGYVNSLLQQVADINTVIREEDMYGNSALELRDQRNLLLDELSQYVNITVEYRVPEGGRVEECYVYLKGVTDDLDNEPIPLVSSGKCNQFAYQPSKSDSTGTSALQQLLNGSELSLQLVDGVSGLQLKGNCDLTQLIYSGQIAGQLGGFISAINGSGTAYAAGDNIYQGIQYYRQALNDFAITFGNMMNYLNTPDYSSRINYLNTHIEDINAKLLSETDPNEIDALKAERIEYMNRLNEIVPIGCVELNLPNASIAWDPDDADNFDFDNYFVIDGTGNLLLMSGGAANTVEPQVVADGSQLDPSGVPYPAGTVISMSIVDSTGAPIVAPPGSSDIVDLANNIDLLNENGRPLFVYNDSKGAIYSARYMSVNQEWADNPSWLTANLGFGVDGGEESNLGDNLARFLDALTNGPGGNYDITFIGGSSLTFDEFLSGIFVDIGADLASNETLLDASLTVWETVISQRDAVSAVSADEEAISMMIYQNYYNAAARYMTTLDEALGTVIQSMGVVGR